MRYGKGKPVGCCVGLVIYTYEFIGTAAIMYALMMAKGQYTWSVSIVTFCAMNLAWKVSGGHFNPAITVGMFVAEKKCMNFVIALTMILGQFSGAFFGILLGYLSLIDTKKQNET